MENISARTISGHQSLNLYEHFQIECLFYLKGAFHNHNEIPGDTREAPQVSTGLGGCMCPNPLVALGICDTSAPSQSSGCFLNFTFK